MFIPTIIIGLIGGLLGAVFTILHLKMTRGRKRLLANIQSEWLQKILRIFEPAVIIVRKLYEETNSNYCREITFIYKYNAFKLLFILFYMCMQIFGFKLRNLCKNLEILIYFHVSEQKCYCWCENVFWGKKR